MFTTSDKVVLGLCGALAIAGILMVHKGLKGLKEIQERKIVLRRLEEIK